MTRDILEQKIAPLLPRLRDELSVTGLWVFGSVCRGTAQDQSDVDLIVEFGVPATFNLYMEVKEMLEAELGLPVDLVTRRAIRPELQGSIEREAVRVA
jgi:predicted nucleotidyltransferase